VNTPHLWTPEHVQAVANACTGFEGHTALAAFGRQLALGAVREAGWRDEQHRDMALVHRQPVLQVASLAFLTAFTFLDPDDHFRWAFGEQPGGDPRAVDVALGRYGVRGALLLGITQGRLEVFFAPRRVVMHLAVATGRLACARPSPLLEFMERAWADLRAELPRLPSFAGGAGADR
jgi:hypothetical protein